MRKIIFFISILSVLTVSAKAQSMTELNRDAAKKLNWANVDVTVTCYPNPVVDYANLRFDQTPPANYRYSVSTEDGKIVQTGTFAISTTGQQVAINLSTAPKGMLIVRLEVGDATASIFQILKK
jgi:Secretion system C-terminal sorting domain